MLLLLVYVGWQTIYPSYSKKLTSTISVTHTPTPEKSDQQILFRDTLYQFSYFLVKDPNKLLLIPNFKAKTRASILASQNQCLFAINGGFYDTNNEPLGMFKGNGYVEPTPLLSNLLNGYLSFSETKADIASIPHLDYKTILQSGPLLILENSSLRLNIKNDENARRTVAATTEKNEILFITFYVKDSIYNGPLLQDLPNILIEFEKISGIDIRDALNLDGGSASYFSTPSETLPELNDVGSLFCLTE